MNRRIPRRIICGFTVHHYDRWATKPGGFFVYYSHVDTSHSQHGRSLRIPVLGIEEHVVSPEVASCLSRLSSLERMKLVDEAFRSAREMVELCVRAQRPDLVGRAYEDEVLRRLTGGDIDVLLARKRLA